MKRVLPLLLIALVGLPVAHGEDLLQVYELAMTNDAQLRAALASKNSTLEVRPQARAQLLPNLALSGDAARVHADYKSAPGGSSDYTAKSATLALSQPLIHADYWIQLDQANEQVAKAEVTYAAAEQDLIVRVAKAYFGVLAAQDNLEFAKAENTAIARQLEQAQQRFEVGLIAITDVYEAQAAYDQSRADLIDAENNVDNAWEALREIIHTPVSTLGMLTEELPLNPPQPEGIEQWSIASQQNNLNIRAGQRDVEIARQNIDLQGSGHLPTLDLVGSHTLSRTGSPTGIDADTSSVGVELNLPLYAGGGVSSRVRQAGFDLEAAQENLDVTRRAVDRQVRDGYRGVVASISQVEALKAGIVSAQSALESSEAGLEVGTRTMVDVLSAQRDLYRARSNYANVRYNYVLNGLLLKQAAGSLGRDDLVQLNNWLQ